MSNDTATGLTIAPPEVWDPVAASQVAGVVGPIASGVYIRTFFSLSLSL